MLRKKQWPKRERFIFSKFSGQVFVAFHEVLSVIKFKKPIASLPIARSLTDILNAWLPKTTSGFLWSRYSSVPHPLIAVRFMYCTRWFSYLKASVFFFTITLNTKINDLFIICTSIASTTISFFLSIGLLNGCRGTNETIKYNIYFFKLEPSFSVQCVNEFEILEWFRFDFFPWNSLMGGAGNANLNSHFHLPFFFLSHRMRFRERNLSSRFIQSNTSHKWWHFKDK